MDLKEATTVNIKMGPFVDMTDGVTPETGLTPTVKLSKNGGTLAARNSATATAHDADGYYTVELNATDTNTRGRLRATATAAATHLPVWEDFNVLAGPEYDAKYGASFALQAGASTSATLDSGAVATDDYYNGLRLTIIGGTGAGQSRRITDYVGSTKVATVEPAWITNPGSGSTYILESDAVEALTAAERTAIASAVAAPSAGTIAAAVAAPTAVAIANEVQTRTIASVTALNSTERNAIADALLDRTNGIESGVTPRQAERLILASTAGKISGASSGSGTVTVRNAVADSKNRLVVTNDANGNRTAITYDVTT